MFLGLNIGWMMAMPGKEKSKEGGIDYQGILELIVSLYQVKSRLQELSVAYDWVEWNELNDIIEMVDDALDQVMMRASKCLKEGCNGGWL